MPMSEAFRNSAFPDWLITAKVHPALQRADLLPRHSLTTRLDRELNGSLTLLHAPAGYGKSTALVGWRSALLSRQIHVAWVSLDKDDNDPYQLVLYLALALSVAGVDLSRCGIGSGATDGWRSARRLLSSLHSAVERHDRRVVLMLDDFENLSVETVDEIIDPLVRYAPTSLQIAIASRNDTRLKISDLDLRGLVYRVGAEDLRFTHEELVEFLHPGLDMAQIRKVFELTEGWPVAVQLLKTATRSRQAVANLLHNLTEAGGKLADYLSEQVFGELSEETREFLADVSIVDRVDPNLADFLRESEDSATLFYKLRHLDALITPLDGAQRSWRLHPLFREYLYEYLNLGNRERAVHLHRRAARWFGDQGRLVHSVRHYVSANDQGGGAQAIENSGGLMRWLSEGLTPFRSALDLLDRETVHSRPRLALIRCLILMKTGRSHEAKRLYESLVDGLPETAESERLLAYEMMVIESLLYAYDARGLSNEFLCKLEQSRTAFPQKQPIFQGHHYTVLCGLNSSCGYFSRARRFGHEAIGAFREAGSIYGEIYIHIHLGIIAFRRGETDTAQRHYDHALKLIRTRFGDDEAMKLIVAVLLAELRYDLNRLNLVPQNIATCPKRLERFEAWFDIYAVAYVTASNVALNRYGTDVALTMIDEGMDFAARRHFASLRNLIACQKATLLLRVGRPEEADSLMADSGLRACHFKHSGARKVAWRERDMVVQTIVRLHIACGRNRDALSEIDAFLPIAESEDNVRSIIGYRILKSLAHFADSGHHAAVGEFRQALILTGGSGSIRAFLDEGPLMPALLKLVAESVEVDEYASEAFNGDAARETTDGESMREVIARARMLGDLLGDRRAKPESRLTVRELEILRELGNGYSNKVIARNVGVSHNTVRYHLKNIFVKLNVHSRLSAVRAAQEADII